MPGKLLKARHLRAKCSGVRLEVQFDIDLEVFDMPKKGKPFPSEIIISAKAHNLMVWRGRDMLVLTRPWKENLDKSTNAKWQNAINWSLKASTVASDGKPSCFFSLRLELVALIIRWRGDPCARHWSCWSDTKSVEASRAGCSSISMLYPVQPQDQVTKRHFNKIIRLSNKGHKMTKSAASRLGK